MGIEGRRVNEGDDKDLTIFSLTIFPGYMDYKKILLSVLWTSEGTQMPVEGLPIKFKCWSFFYSFCSFLVVLFLVFFPSTVLREVLVTLKKNCSFKFRALPT